MAVLKSCLLGDSHPAKLTIKFNHHKVGGVRGNGAAMVGAEVQVVCFGGGAGSLTEGGRNPERKGKTLF